MQIEVVDIIYDLNEAQFLFVHFRFLGLVVEVVERRAKRKGP